ncbi:MAG TPA: isoprenylcysteine carboxylmethyltransferase family protein [Candidatus Eisenbacteria bacterium]|nr:isoprenylcysteine carboxylmethyltransferase family protein [Candidatus Eisenbacteria bacterium]
MTSHDTITHRPARDARQVRRYAMLIAAGVGAWFGAALVRAPGGSAHAALAAISAGMAGGFPWGMKTSLVLWVVLSLYWELAARGASMARRSESAGSRMVHLVILGAGQLVLLMPMPGLRARFLPTSTPLIAAGLAVEVAAVVFSIWARRALGRHWSGEITAKVGHELVRSGPYARVRHPIYTGMFALCIGTALVSGEVHALVGLALVVIAFVRKIRMEEKNLAELFGPTWEEYRRATRALVPGVI